MIAIISAVAVIAGVVAADNRSSDATGTRAAASAAASLFAPCRPGSGGGGFRVRTVAISCREVRKVLPRMLGQQPPLVRRRGEYVYRNNDGWSCLVQALPRVAESHVTCVRKHQVISYRVG